MEKTWFENTFDWCVETLLSFTDTLGLTYEALNDLVFVIIVLIILLISIAINFYLFWKSGTNECNSTLIEKKIIKTNPYLKTLKGQGQN